MAPITLGDQMLSGMKIWIAGLFGALIVSACATTDTAPPPAETTPPPAQEIPEPETPEPEEPETPDEPDEPDTAELVRDGLTPPHMKGRDLKRLALLLPLSSRSDRLRDEAGSMLRAAEMAVFNRGEADVVLIALDTAGTPDGAASATRAAIESGADVILGPVLARSVIASGEVAQNSGTPVIAFSTDQQVAGNGIYLLSFPPEAEVKRIVEYAASTGVQRYAFLGPDSAYGKRVKAAYERNVAQMAGEVRASETYQGDDISVMQAPARKIADYYKSRVRNSNSRLPYEAVMLPESGTSLRSLAPLLPFYDIDPANVQFMGTGLWHRDDVVKEPALGGGIFAGPDKSVSERFEAEYDEQYGEEPGQLASLAYDAVNIGAFVAAGSPRGRHARAQDAEGFFGVDGLVRFNSDGTPDRGLAVYQIQRGQFVIIDPAPRTFTGPS